MDVVKVTQGLLDLFEAKRVYDTVGNGPRRWRPGQKMTLLGACQIEPYVTIIQGFALPRVMGAFSYSHSALRPYVAVGRYCSIGGSVSWLAGRHPHEWASTSPVVYEHEHLQGINAYFRDVGQVSQVRPYPDPSGLVRIGHDVWIGDHAMIAKGVAIGDGAVIGARAMVLKDVPPYAVVMGQPAEVKRLRFPEALVERFKAAEWWRYRPEFIQSLRVDDPERFLDALEAAVAGDAPPEVMQPRILTGAEVLAAAEASER
jgi:acetyltransferase-like isoleucine patch superfamily enzyme